MSKKIVQLSLEDHAEAMSQPQLPDTGDFERDMDLIKKMPLEKLLKVCQVQKGGDEHESYR